MEISVRYLHVVFVFLVAVLVVITLYDSITDEKLESAAEDVILSLKKCILRQALNVLWVSASIIIYIKHRQVNDILNRYDMHPKKTLNRITLRTGLLAAFGGSIMANFQQTDCFYAYWFGAVLLFGVGALYQCIQTVQYRHLANVIGQKKTTMIRMALSTVSVISFIVFFVCAVLAFAQKKSGNYLFWHYEDNGFISYKTSIVFEWVCATSTTIYFILFLWEFKRITLYEPDVFVEDKVATSVNMERTNKAFEDK